MVLVEPPQTSSKIGSMPARPRATPFPRPPIFGFRDVAPLADKQGLVDDVFPPSGRAAPLRPLMNDLMSVGLQPGLEGDARHPR